MSGPARSFGRALAVTATAGRTSALAALEAAEGGGYQVETASDPYAAMLELCRRPLAYRALVLSLNGLYREELRMIQTVKRRYPHLDVFVSEAAGMPSALAEAMRLGADGMISEEGIHRFEQRSAPPPELSTTEPSLAPQTATAAPRTPDESKARTPERTSPAGDRGLDIIDPVLTAEELRALLGEPGQG